MFRTGFALSKKLLCPIPIPVKLTPELCASWYTSIYDVRRSTRVKDVQRPLLLPADQSFLSSRHVMIPGSQSLLPIRQALPSCHILLSTGFLLQDSSKIRFASDSFQMPNPANLACNLINMARCIDLKHLNDAPPPAFWVTITSTAAQLGIPFLELIGGYSPIMTYLQLYIAAASLIWNGGQTWGLAMSKNSISETSWDTMNMSLIPTGIAILGLILPYPLGFLTVISGLVTSLYCDLKSCVYPHWAIAAKFLVAVSSTIGLLLALVAYVLFHNRENAKKKKSRKEVSPAEESEDKGVEGEGGEKEK